MKLLSRRRPARQRRRSATCRLSLTNEKGVYVYKTTLFAELGKTDAFANDDYEYTDEAEYEGGGGGDGGGDGGESAPRGSQRLPVGK